MLKNFFIKFENSLGDPSLRSYTESPYKYFSNQSL